MEREIKVPPCPFAVFDEFGKPADDRVQDYARAALADRAGAQTELLQAAQAVVDRWDSPNWSDGTHTADYIHRLRRAIRAADTVTIKGAAAPAGTQEQADAGGVNGLDGGQA